jgi:hypothetical protein
VPTLVALLRNTNSKRVEIAATALGQMGQTAREALPALREVATKAKDLSVRAAAGNAVYQIENPRN